jgi:hypothetical protein
MKVREVMVTDVVTVRADTPYGDIRGDPGR